MAYNASVTRFKCACCSAKVILLNWRPEARRHRRKAATASKAFFFVAIGKEGWSHDANGEGALATHHRLKARLPSQKTKQRGTTNDFANGEI